MFEAISGVKKVRGLRRPIVMLLCFVLVSAISMALMVPAKAAVTISKWQPPYVDIDGTVVYKEGVTASALIGIINDVHPEIMMNVSKIVLEFYNLGINRTLDMSASPHQLEHNDYGAFTLSFTADAAVFYPGLSYDFNLIIEWINATTGPQEIVGYWEFPTWWTGMQRFEVYPASQVDAMDSLQKYQSYYDYYYYYYWQSMAAREKSTQALVEKGLGDTYYDRGDYANALAKYNLANTLWEEAVAAEKNWRTTMENADLNVSLTEASASLAQGNAALIEANSAAVQADAAMTSANGWFFIGIGFAIGFSLIGVGAVVYAIRKPKAPA